MRQHPLATCNWKLWSLDWPSELWTLSTYYWSSDSGWVVHCPCRLPQIWLSSPPWMGLLGLGCCWLSYLPPRGGLTPSPWRSNCLLMEKFTVSSWITNCLLMENSLPPRGDITVSLSRTHYLLLESSIYSSPCGDITVSLWRKHCLFSWRTCYDVFVVFWISQRFCRVILWIALLGPISHGYANVTVRISDSGTFVVFLWIAPLGPIFIGGADVTVRLLWFTEICCCRLRTLLWPS